MIKGVFKSIVILLLLVVGSFLVIGALPIVPVSAHPVVLVQSTPPLVDLSTPQALLAALLFPVFAVNWIALHVLNTYPAWLELDPRRQSLILLVIALIVALAAYAALQLIPGVVLASFQPIYAIIYALISAYLGGQFGNFTGLRTQIARTRLLADHERVQHDLLVARKSG